MSATIELDVLSVVILVFAIALASRSLYSKPSNRWYILSALTLIVVIGTELFAYQVDDIGSSSQIFWHTITNVFGFGLSPLFVYFLFRYITHGSHLKRPLLMLLPAIINGVLSISSYFTGWYFSVDAMNVYKRGPIFFIAVVTMFLYLGFCVLYLINTWKHYETADRPLFASILTVPIIGFIMQMIFPTVLMLWPGNALSILLFYLFSQEQYYAFDVLTDLRNRAVFMRDLMDLQHDYAGPATIVVCDVNDLKKANDNYGHVRGDELLSYAANLLEQCFGMVGKIYRIGGDEFAVISTVKDPKDIEESVAFLGKQIEFNNQDRTIPLSLALGWSWCESCIGNLFNTYVSADDSMYRNKGKMKSDRR